MSAYTVTIGGDDGFDHFVGYSGDTFRSSVALPITTENVSGAVGATNKPILVTFMRQTFPTNSGTSARLELDTASTGTPVYSSTYRNCSSTEDVTPNYFANAGATIWYGFRTNSSATIYFNQKATTGFSDIIVRYKASTAATSNWSTSQSLYGRLDWYGVPGAPTSLVASSVSPDSVSLSWTRNADMGGYAAGTGYRILYKKTSDSAWSSTGQFGNDTTTSFTIAGLIPGTSYDFLVAATNAVSDTYNTTYLTPTATVGTNASLTTTTLVGGVRDSSGFWVTPITKVWTGSDWTAADIYAWTGTEWKKQ